mgnify:CR=1 FL=1
MNVILLIYKKVVAFLPEHHHNLFSFTMINIWLLLCHLNNPISKEKFISCYLNFCFPFKLIFSDKIFLEYFPALLQSLANSWS